MTLLQAALNLSDRLHDLETQGFDIPKSLDDAWALLTEAIENERNKK